MDIWFIFWVFWTIACIFVTINNIKVIIINLRKDRERRSIRHAKFLEWEKRNGFRVTKSGKLVRIDE
jgi:hypothetical protein